MPATIVYDNEYAIPILGGKNPTLRKNYTLQSHEASSLQEIKKSLRNGYPDRDTVQSHMDYLEGLATKLSQIIADEEREGFVNWDLKKELESIRVLYQQLMGSFAKPE